MRAELKLPFGKVFSLELLLASLGDCRRIVSVGDVVSRDLIESRVFPDLVIYDGRTKRCESSELAERVEKEGGPDAVVKNPPGTISLEMTKAIREALENDDTYILVEGEEDLAALVCVALAPKGSCVVYGCPDRGAVLVRVDETSSNKAESLLSKMEVLR
ncbi:MAG: GTP-dependent dephospho-CoA kinase family protein [Methanomassiliicoccales archaeon]